MQYRMVARCMGSSPWHAASAKMASRAGPSIPGGKCVGCTAVSDNSVQVEQAFERHRLDVAEGIGPIIQRPEPDGVRGLPAARLSGADKIK